MRMIVQCALAVVALLALGCKEEKPPPVFRITFLSSADGLPLPGVKVSTDGSPRGETDAAGELAVQITGAEGQVVGVAAECPEGHRTPTELPVLTLRSFQGLDPRAAERGIEVNIPCPPAQRVAAVAVLAVDQDSGSGFADLPVLYRGQEVARTDAQGVAHMHFRVDPTETLTLVLDTSANDKLQPQNPRSNFTLRDADATFAFSQRFELKRKRRPTTRRRPVAMAGPMLPVRIN